MNYYDMSDTEFEKQIRIKLNKLTNDKKMIAKIIDNLLIYLYELSIICKDKDEFNSIMTMHINHEIEQLND